MQVLCCPACLATIEQDRLKVGVEDPEFGFVLIQMFFCITIKTIHVSYPDVLIEASMFVNHISRVDK